MIDVEREVFSLIDRAIEQTFGKDRIPVSGGFDDAPPSFPCVTVAELSNSAFRRTGSSDQIENHADVTYEANVFSNRTTGKKAECRRILAVIDETLGGAGFTRIFMQPVPNADRSVYRLTARYRAVVSREHVIYRR